MDLTPSGQQNEKYSQFSTCQSTHGVVISVPSSERASPTAGTLFWNPPPASQVGHNRSLHHSSPKMALFRCPIHCRVPRPNLSLVRAGWLALLLILHSEVDLPHSPERLYSPARSSPIGPLPCPSPGARSIALPTNALAAVTARGMLLPSASPKAIAVENAHPVP